MKQITHVTDRIYSKADRSAIDCTVTFDDGNTYPYTAVPNDSTDYGVKLWTDLLAGVHGSISAFPGVPQATLLAAFEAHRTRLAEGGFTFNGMTVATDDRTAIYLGNMKAEARENPHLVIDWDSADGGYVQLTAPDIIAIADAAFAHVQKCYSRGKAIAEGIKAGNFNSVAQITAAFDAAMAA